MTDLSGLMPYSLCYVASPYTLYEDGLDKACEDVARLTMDLHKRGVKVFSPIVYAHSMAASLGIDPKDHDFWMRFNDPFIETCDALLIGMFKGWEESKGIAMEVERFDAAGKDILFIDPTSLELLKAR